MSDDDENWQRAKNLLLFKMYLTDEEISEAMPWTVGVVVLVVVVIMLIMANR